METPITSAKRMASTKPTTLPKVTWSVVRLPMARTPMSALLADHGCSDPRRSA